jgi:hypothetical protein
LQKKLQLDGLPPYNFFHGRNNPHQGEVPIRYSIDRGTFDPLDFVKKEIKYLHFENYIQTWIARRQPECERQPLLI